MPPSCGVSLVEQHSFATCKFNASFGCLHGASRSIWVRNCRGVFRCADDPHPFRCGYPPGLTQAYKCGCDSGRDDPFWSLSDEETAALHRPLRKPRAALPHRKATRYALLLHGLLGTELSSSSGTLVASHSPHSAARDGGHAGRRMLLRHCAATHLRYVVDPSAARGMQVDVFAHSWNREAAPWFAEAYGAVLRRSQHEPPVFTNLTLKARSQALSIARAANLMREFSALRRVTYTLALALRTDAMISAPVALDRLPTGSVTFAHWCCKHRAMMPAACATGGAAAGALPVLAHCMVGDYTRYLDESGSRSKAVRSRRTADIERRYFVMDWWLAGPPALVASWERIASEWDEYAARNEELGIGNLWSHFIWAQHVHEVLRTQPRFSSAVCAQIARHHFEAVRTLQDQARGVESGKALALSKPWGGCFVDHDGNAPLKPTPDQCPRHCEHAPEVAANDAAGVTASVKVQVRASAKGDDGGGGRRRGAVGGGKEAGLSCRVYVHDPGARFNAKPMADPRERWGDLDHNWHLAYWLHRGLLGYARRTTRVEDADVVVVAHYFLTHNPKAHPLNFEWPLLGWEQVLRVGGPGRLFRNQSALQQRWRDRPQDFVVAPILKACHGARGFLDAARWVLTEPWFGRCLYRHGFDVIAPQVVSSDVWAPSRRSDAPDRRRRHFLTYVGKLCKVYIQPPMTLLRFTMWAYLRAHPNVTFLAVDVPWVVTPYLPAAGPDAQPSCRRCSYACKQCIRLPAATANVPLSVGSTDRLTSKDEYRSLLANSTFCLVMRGDNENTRKFTEAILAGCIPVLIADMPSWPFARRLDYRSFSYEFDWRKAIRDPHGVVRALLAVPAEEIAAKQRKLLNVRRHFFYHDDVARPGAVRQLIQDICTAPTVLPSMASEIATAKHLATPSTEPEAAKSVVARLGYPAHERLYAMRLQQATEPRKNRLAVGMRVGKVNSRRGRRKAAKPLAKRQRGAVSSAEEETPSSADTIVTPGATSHGASGSGYGS